MERICHVSVRVFSATSVAKLVITYAFLNFLNEIFRFNVKIYVYLMFLLGFLILVSRKTEIWPILYISRGFLAINEAI